MNARTVLIGGIVWVALVAFFAYAAWQVGEYRRWHDACLLRGGEVQVLHSFDRCLIDGQEVSRW